MTTRTIEHLNEFSYREISLLLPRQKRGVRSITAAAKQVVQDADEPLDVMDVAQYLKCWVTSDQHSAAPVHLECGNLVAADGRCPCGAHVDPADPEVCVIADPDDEE